MAKPKFGCSLHVKIQVSVDPFDIGEDFRFILNGSAAEFLARVQSAYGYNQSES